MITKILVVDDEQMNLDIVSDYLLDENPGFEVLTASDGQEALEILEKEKNIDLVLTDWNMPVMDGIQLVKAIKANPAFKQIPVLMQTANTTPAELKIAFDAGVMDYIRKPIEPVEMLARVKAALAFHYEKQKSEQLLLKIFPEEVAEELKERNDATPRYFKSASILFADVNGFSTTARRLKDEPHKLVKMLDRCFEALDDIAIRHGIERIKTIGDCYMAVAGVPTETHSHALDLVLAGLEMQAVIEQATDETREVDQWRLRMGIHTGDLVAEVIGRMKFTYDVWGDSVNLASRLETTGIVGRVHISTETYQAVKEFFVCEKRPEMIEAKNISKVQSYFVERLKPEFCTDEAGLIPNAVFAKRRESLING
ncbi:MAG: hypothetical protein OHK0053_25240 [Microscillaceae bacterium]